MLLSLKKSVLLLTGSSKYCTLALETVIKQQVVDENTSLLNAPPHGNREKQFIKYCVEVIEQNF